MTKLQSLQDIKDTAVRLLVTLVAEADIESIRTAKKELQQLADRFYLENEETVAIQQYEMAKKDSEYFMRLVDLAVSYYRDEDEGGKELQGVTACFHRS